MTGRAWVAMPDPQRGRDALSAASSYRQRGIASSILLAETPKRLALPCMVRTFSFADPVHVSSAGHRWKSPSWHRLFQASFLRPSLITGSIAAPFFPGLDLMSASIIRGAFHFPPLRDSPVWPPVLCALGISAVPVPTMLQY